MKKKLNPVEIEEEVTNTLKLLDENPGIKFNPFFYTRLRARINDQQKKQITPNWIKSRYLLPVSVAVLLIINLLTAGLVLRSGSTIEESSSVERFVEMYSIEN